MDQELQQLYNKLYAHTAQPSQDPQKTKVREHLLQKIYGKEGVKGRLRIHILHNHYVAGSYHRRVHLEDSDTDILVPIQITNSLLKQRSPGRPTEDTEFVTTVDRIEVAAKDVVTLFSKTIKPILQTAGASVYKRRCAITIKYQGYEFDFLPCLEHNGFELIANRDETSWASSKRTLSQQNLNEATEKFERVKEAIRILKFLSSRYKWEPLDSFTLEQLAIQYVDRHSAEWRFEGTRGSVIYCLKELINFDNPLMQNFRKQKYTKFRSQLKEDVTFFLANEKAEIEKMLR